MDLSYKELYMINPQKARLKMIEVYQREKNVSKVARLFHTSRNLVYKWLKHFSNTS